MQMRLEIEPETATDPNGSEPAATDAGEGRLFSSSSLAFGLGPMERRAVDTLEAMHAGARFTPAQMLLAETARALAANIDRGNVKGRAIGNEAMQLAAVLAVLEGDDAGAADGELGDLHPDERAFLEALMSPPAPPAPAA